MVRFRPLFSGLTAENIEARPRLLAGREHAIITVAV
jgi:hypothetical protein